MASRLQNAAVQRFLTHAGVETPVICGPMYPCSNPELVAAVSAAGGLGIVQPISLTYVHGHDFREGLRLIRRLSGGKPIGMNALIEASSEIYKRRMEQWIDIALEEGVRFFVTSLGNPRWIVEKAHAMGAAVYHDATERRFAEKAMAAGVDGLIAVNKRAGGHLGGLAMTELFVQLLDLGVPVICAGGIGDENDFLRALDIGYAGAQLGTRFIATNECEAPQAYKDAIVRAAADDVVTTERLSGVPVAVLNTESVKRLGQKAGRVARWMLSGRRTKHWMRTIYGIRSIMALKRGLHRDAPDKDFWQAGKSVASISSIEPAGDIVRRFALTLSA
ncbi:MAG: nitronate monooxygenase [Vicinamibacteria bacterium]|nr:nitronate monooxygenase [Vicinamibacteria bacterium]